MVGAQGYLWIARGPHFTGRRARTDALEKVTFTVEGEPHCILLSQIHRSLCLIVRKASLLDQPLVDRLGLTTRVLPEDIVAISGIYVDDLLTAGPKIVVHSYLATLRQMWKTSEPLYLRLDAELPFRGVTLRKTKDGILLHQHLYTQEFLREYSSHISAKKRTTSGEPDHFKKDPPPGIDHSNPEHMEWVKIGQRILGGILCEHVQTWHLLFHRQRRS